MLQTRVKKLRSILSENNIDAFLISNFHNVIYLTGFKTLTSDEREGWALITKKNIYLFTDSRYLNDESPVLSNPLITLKLITPEKGLIKHLQEIIIREEIARLGFEGDDLKVSEHKKIKEYLTPTELVSMEKLVVKIREIKDDLEISNLRKACSIADECLKELIKDIKIGTTEKEIALKIEFWLKKKGYEMAFYPIIAIDKNSSVPHYDTLNGNNAKVKKNSIILIDYGAKFHDYHSDTTRMIFVGEPTAEMKRVYKILLDAQEKTIEQLRVDNNPVSIDQFCRQQLADVNQELTYSHSTGHGVGLHIHEFPKISFISTDVLLPNQVVTVEPGIYFEDKWGMRIEDTVLIKDGNKVEVLTNFSKKMLVIK